MAGDKPNKLKRIQPDSLLSLGPPYPLISLDSVNELASVEPVLYSAEFGCAGNGFADEVENGSFHDNTFRPSPGSVSYTHLTLPTILLV